MELRLRGLQLHRGIISCIITLRFVCSLGLREFDGRTRGEKHYRCNIPTRERERERVDELPLYLERREVYIRYVVGNKRRKKWGKLVNFESLRYLGVNPRWSCSSSTQMFSRVRVKREKRERERKKKKINKRCWRKTTASRGERLFQISLSHLSILETHYLRAAINLETSRPLATPRTT